MPRTVHTAVLRSEVSHTKACDTRHRKHLLHWAGPPPVTTFPFMPHGTPNLFSKFPGLNGKARTIRRNHPNESKAQSDARKNYSQNGKAVSQKVNPPQQGGGGWGESIRVGFGPSLPAFRVGYSVYFRVSPCTSPSWAHAGQAPILGTHPGKSTFLPNATPSLTSYHPRGSNKQQHQSP